MKKQNKNIFAALVHQNADMLLTFIRATIRDPATVDDIFQETMLIAWRRFDDYDPIKPLAKWLRGIARKLILAHFSRLKKRPVFCSEDVLDVLDDRLSHIGSQLGDTWTDKVAALDVCLQQLPEPMHQCIKLFYQDEQKTEDIASVVNLTREAVKKRLQRARSMIVDCLRRKGLFPTASAEVNNEQE